MILVKHKIWCNTESKFKYSWRDAQDTSPLVCPKNDSHSIDSTKTTIVKRAGDQVLEVKPSMAEDWKPYKSKGFQFDTDPLAPPTSPTITIKDFLITDDLFLRGGSVEAYNASFKDFFCVYVVDVDNLLGYGAGLVITEYMDTEQCYFDPSTSKCKNEVFNESISATSLKGFYVRVKYYSHGIEKPFIKINLKGYQL